MRKLTLSRTDGITFEEGCNKYLDNCRQRNLRAGTLGHYRQTYTQLFKYFDPDMPVSQFDKAMYDDYVRHLQSILHNDVSINSYLRDVITTFHFLMEEGYVNQFKMTSIKVDKTAVQTYTEDELRLLLQKPNIKQSNFIDYQAWVMTNFLFSTGVRQRSLMNIQIRDVDLDNLIVNVRVTKNRKPLIVPINTTLANILKEFLRYRQHKNGEDWLFCNVFGQQLVKSTCYHMLYNYNKRRGVETTGIHRYRHTFAKQWVINGGNVVTLSRLLGHSSLQITQNYINLLVSDLSKQVEDINLIDKFSAKQRIKSPSKR